MKKEQLNRMTAVFLLAGAVCLVLIWVIFFLTGITTDFFSHFGFHNLFLMIAEMITAVMMAAAGTGILKKKLWAEGMKYLALGMLSYALILGTGQFLESGIYIVVILFLLVLSAALVILYLNLFRKKE